LGPAHAQRQGQGNGDDADQHGERRVGKGVKGERVPDAFTSRHDVGAAEQRRNLELVERAVVLAADFRH
jgi:hypothetical protein